MEEVLKGIVLTSVNYGESDKILNVFTLEKGVVSAKIKGVKKATAKLRFAQEPFCFAEFVFNKTNEKRIVTGASLIDSFYPIRSDIEAYYSGGVILEFIKKFLKEEMISEELFFLAVKELKNMAYKDKDYLRYVAEFLTEGLKITGYALNTEKCFNCNKEIDGRTYFDYNNGGFLCEDCFNGEGREINYSTYKTLKNIEQNGEIVRENAVKVLKLLDFYLSVKPEVNLNSLKELLKIIN